MNPETPALEDMDYEALEIKMIASTLFPIQPERKVTLTKEPMMICNLAERCLFASTGNHCCCQHSAPHEHGSSCEWSTDCGEDKETGERLTGACIPV
jgi:hypothetical protein